MLNRLYACFDQLKTLLVANKAKWALSNSISVVDFVVSALYFECKSSGLDWILKSLAAYLTADPVKIAYIKQLNLEFGKCYEKLIAPTRDDGYFSEIEGCETCYI